MINGYNSNVILKGYFELIRTEAYECSNENKYTVAQ